MVIPLTTAPTEGELFSNILKTSLEDCNGAGCGGLTIEEAIKDFRLQKPSERRAEERRQRKSAAGSLGRKRYPKNQKFISVTFPDGKTWMVCTTNEQGSA